MRYDQLPPTVQRVVNLWRLSRTERKRMRLRRDEACQRALQAEASLSAADAATYDKWLREALLAREGEA